ncbi:SDR family NAD(P)-dependent oxidoreductase [Paenibacillus flagellatus]|uniref:SDR family NAD(P)-dependent oxidoreductase n=1 Tax=Paenibacillus flagellatus TaxID=2211139 RepID=UPI0013050B13|nr:SDR family NAD(P)-dependent oxidoreductase [Paenibacillus flagellatus]
MIVHYRIVTGVSRGIGAALAERLLGPDRLVIGIARNDNEAVRATAEAKGCGYRFVPFDLADTTGIDGLMDELFRSIDRGRARSVALVNNAASLSPLRPIHACTDREIAGHYAVNLLAPVLLTKHFVGRTAGWNAVKSVVNVSSGSAEWPMAGMAPYCSSKAGLNAFTQCVALEQQDVDNSRTRIRRLPGHGRDRHAAAGPDEPKRRAAGGGTVSRSVRGGAADDPGTGGGTDRSAAGVEGGSSGLDQKAGRCGGGRIRMRSGPIQSLVLGIPVAKSDYDRAIDWYVGALGFELVWKKGVAQLRMPNGQKLLVFDPDDDPDSIWYAGDYEAHPHYSVQLVVGDLEKLTERLTGSGARLGPILRGGGGGRDMRIDDPFGNRWWAIEDPKPNAAAPSPLDEFSRKSSFGRSGAATDRIRLRPTGAGDLDFVVDAETAEGSRPYVGQWTRERHAEAIDDPDAMHAVIVRLGDGQRIGYVIAQGLREGRSIELKRLVVTEPGNGYGRETVRLVKRLAFAEWRARRLWLDVRAGNTRAERLYRSEGFQIEGVLRDADYADGRYVSLAVLSMLADEYVPEPAAGPAT